MNAQSVAALVRMADRLSAFERDRRPAASSGRPGDDL
jgi:hypothetical protein